MSHSRCLVCFLAVGIATCALGDDTVTFRGGKGAQQILRRTGKINDYTGAGLIITTTSGRQETIPAERVIEIETIATPEELSGDLRYSEGKLTAAIDAYQAAQSLEPRRWVARRISAQLVNCYELAGQFNAAGDEFIALVASDEQTPYFAAIPLAWRTSALDAPAVTQASKWLGNDSPTAQLLGASWLLSGGQREQAMTALTALSRDLDPRIAHLAAAQLWRTSLATASSSDLARWQQQIKRMPAEIRAGPLLVLGDGLTRQDRPEDALLAYLQAPLVYPQRSALAGEGYLAAARLCEKRKRTSDAERLLLELQTKQPIFAKQHLKP